MTYANLIQDAFPEHVILEAAQKIYLRQAQRGDLIQDPAQAKTHLYNALHLHPREVFAGLFLDNRHRVITLEELFYGTIDAASVYPRVVVHTALKHNAAAVIFAHNHPSGDAEPSQADINITRRLKSALDLLDIRLIDHIVVGHDTTVSLAERKLL